MTTRIPLPPPPCAALIAIGYPNSSARVATSSTDGGSGSDVPGTIGTPASAACRAGGDLVAHGLDGRSGRADPDESGLGDCFSEPGVLGEKPVAGMDGIGAGGRGDLENLL